MLFNLSKGAFTTRSFQYSGDSSFARSGTDYMIVLENSNANGSTFRLLKTIAKADICLVGGGNPGNSGNMEGNGSAGGNGGEIINIYSVNLPAGDYTVIVGESGKNTVLTAPDGRTWTARCGNGALGGRQPGSSGSDGENGSAAWNDNNTLLRPGWIYGSGGGVGYVKDYQYIEYAAGRGGTVGTASESELDGHGGTSSHRAGYAGLSGAGQGGGGGTRVWNGSGYENASGGDGGSGAILIRKHKEVT